MNYYKQFLDFLQRHKLYERESFVFISNHTVNINYNNQEERDFIGCYYSKDEEDKITNFKVWVPEIIDTTTLFINIHEYVHALILYKYLNEKYEIGLEKEALPLMYEKMYAIEEENISAKDYEKNLKETINEINTEEYIIGKKIAEELIYKHDDIKLLNEKAKELVRKYKY